VPNIVLASERAQFPCGRNYRQASSDIRYQVIRAVYCSVRDDRPSVWLRALPTISACACFGLTIWLGAHGIIGLRTWAW